MRWSSLWFPWITAASIATAACAAKGQAPLNIHPGLSRDQAISSLRALRYCRGDIPMRMVETYYECDRPGARASASWVVVEYAKGVLVRLQRFERHAGSGRAAARWDDLVARRIEGAGPPSDAARARLYELRGVPAGAASWAAWFADDSRVLIGVYRLRRGAADDPDILEEILLDSGDTEPSE